MQAAIAATTPKLSVDITTGFTQLFDIFFLGKERHILYRAAILDTAPALLPK